MTEILPTALDYPTIRRVAMQIIALDHVPEEWPVSIGDFRLLRREMEAHRKALGLPVFAAEHDKPNILVAGVPVVVA